MTDERVKQLQIRALREPFSICAGVVFECLGAIKLLKAEIKDANKAIKLAMKGRK
jgi:hypothetical protein